MKSSYKSTKFSEIHVASVASRESVEDQGFQPSWSDAEVLENTSSSEMDPKAESRGAEKLLPFMHFLWPSPRALGLEGTSGKDHSH